MFNVKKESAYRDLKNKDAIREGLVKSLEVFCVENGISKSKKDQGKDVDKALTAFERAVIENSVPNFIEDYSLEMVVCGKGLSALKVSLRQSGAL